MRIISGSRRGLILETPDGLDTRPTSDRIKETLFNMIAFDIPDCNFLDLFSGSGQIGIEALSRGAAKSIFIEKDKKALSCISNNLKKAKLTDDAVVYSEDVFSGLNRIKTSEPFDIIFMDPPYNKLIEKQVLQQLKDKSYVSEDTLIIVEASLETNFSNVSELGFNIIKEKIYKTNKHIFLKRV